MEQTVVEWASFRLRAGVSQEELLAESAIFQTEFLDRQPGFVRRETLLLPDGGYADIVHWRSMEEANAVMERVATSPACGRLFALMDMGQCDPADAVAHYRRIAAYERSV